jgi:hypothetical protein
MKFRLDHTPPPSPFWLSHKDQLLLMGSCFAEHMGSMLLKHRMNCLVNPGGITFNPLSLAGMVTDSLDGNGYRSEMTLERGGRYFSFLHHSSVNAPSARELEQDIEAGRARLRAALQTATVFFVSFGSAFVYELSGTSAVVSNCHKQPAEMFTRRLLSVEEIVTSWRSLLLAIRTVNPELQVVFTVSPVKHLRDGLENNSVSKATLLLATRELRQNEQCHYFPSYELVTDDLRDYRFYEPDLAHPNALAIQYIWEKFSLTYFSDHTSRVNDEIARLNLSEAHRPLHQNAGEALKLQQSIQKQKERILELEPGLKL